MGLVRFLDGHVEAAHADAEEDVEHGPAEAGGERHHGVSEAGYGDVGNEVAEGVPDCEDCEAENGVGDAEDDAEGFEDADDFIGDRRDPGDGDDEADEAEKEAVLGRFGRCGREE